MTGTGYREAADHIREDLRLKTLPIGVKFAKNTNFFPEKTPPPPPPPPEGRRRF